MSNLPGRHDLILTADGSIVHLWVTPDANGFLEYWPGWNKSCYWTCWRNGSNPASLGRAQAAEWTCQTRLCDDSSVATRLAQLVTESAQLREQEFEMLERPERSQ